MAPAVVEVVILVGERLRIQPVLEAAFGRKGANSMSSELLLVLSAGGGEFED